MAIAMLLALGACSSDSGGNTVGAGADASTTTTTTGATPSGPTVTAKDFSLSSLAVAGGATVTFENTGNATHTMTADDGAFDSGRIAPGSSATITAPSPPGSYPFHCAIHSSMTATLTVEG